MTSGRERHLRAKRDQLRAHQVPLVSDQRLDAFARGWTPSEVHALVASYRALLAFRQHSLELAQVWQSHDDVEVRVRGLELEIDVLTSTSVSATAVPA